MGVVELHPWNATVDDIEHADRLVFDLDPGAGVEWPFVIDTALQVRRMLEEEGFRTWPKVTDGKGVHIMAPLGEPITHDEAHRYSRTIAERIAATNPGRYTVSASMAQRPGRLFIDYLRNGRGTTAAGAWSPRARPRFPIAAPVTWRQVEAGIAPDAFALDSPFKGKRRTGR
jgi:bifunctional non-homologous end joining protein LigD